MPKSSGNLWKFWEELGNLREFPKTSETLQTHFLRLNDLWNFWKTSETVQKYFPDVFMIFKIFGKSSEIFEKLRKRFKSNFQMFLWLFKIFGKSSEIFGNIFGHDFRMSSEMFVMVRRELKGFGARFWEVRKWAPVNCCAQGMMGK